MANSIRITKLKTSTATVELIDDKILILRYDDEFEEENVVTVQENLDALFTIGERGKYPCIIIPSRYALPTSDGRKLIEKELKHLPYVAVVLQGMAQKIIMNFVMTVIGKTKMKIFSNEEQALEWLYKNLNK